MLCTHTEGAKGANDRNIGADYTLPLCVVNAFSQAVEAYKKAGIDLLPLP